MKYDEGKLWNAVVTRAIKDATGKNHTLREEALKWIHSSESFETVCELANLDLIRLTNMLNKIGITNMGDFMSKIKALLIDNIKECVSYLIPDSKFCQERTYLGSLNEDTIMVKIVGKKAGNWRNFTKGTSGDIIDLWTLVKGNIDSAKKWLNAKEPQQNTNEHKITSFSVRHYLNDKSPMPQDIIGPRILTPGGLLVIGGTPKIGKSNFLLSLLVHMAAGVSFLGMKPAKPLKILYLQNEMEYDYIRERLQQLKVNKKVLDIATENLTITPKTKLTLNLEGIERIKSIIAEKFDSRTVDLIVIDSLYNIRDYGSSRAMLSFLQDGIEKLRSITNSAAGIILTHHTKKVSTTMLEKNPFQSLSGAGVLRNFYTSGIVMFRPNKHRNILQVMYELRNGKPIPTKFIKNINGCWKTSKVIATA
ncbi:AAA family ATPase [Wolbachia endosymbiont of Folsomia candida]|uniref:AAA family ATPase n=1 Tax=Wolbachia endosymbiont of Folsomia candida TaxID=169402 RepID=UPI000ADF4FDD|nr:AAA family ATPase [Wolbachia endosymbiont of Folsomia candida]APR99013.1 hypothetical protein ASM33_07455 [Wolbachia endosymbiont of Folsomia candida]